MRLVWVLFLVAIPLSNTLSADDENAKLIAFFKTYLDEEFKLWPVGATRLGDHRFDHLLDDISPQARAADVERYRRLLKELPAQVQYQKLARSSQIDYEILNHSFQRSLWLLENTHPFE